MDLLSIYLNLEEFYRRIYWSVPTATTVTTEAYTMSYSGVRWLDSANQFWFHFPLARTDIQLRLAERFYHKHTADYTINYATPLMEDLGPWLTEHGFRERAINPVLALEGAPTLIHTHPEARIVHVTPGLHDELVQLMYDVFFIGPEVARCVVQPSHLEPESLMRHYLAYIRDAAVGCGTISLSHGIAGVWSVGTLRPYRRKGIASLLLGEMLADAATLNYHQSILLASPMGRPLYESMGYQWIADSIQYGPGL